MATAANLKHATDYFDVCPISVPNYEECVLKSMNKLKPLLQKGIPELKIQPIEPLRITKLEMGDKSGNLRLHLVLSNLAIHGTGTFEFKEFKLNLAKKELLFKSFHPRMDFDSDYSIGGQILILPIQGKGKSAFNFTDITTTSVSKFEEYKKNGKTFIKVVDIDLTIEPGHSYVHLSNLFNGDKKLGEATNKFLNDNWKDAYYAYKELPERAFSEYFKTVTNQVFSQFPKDELFPK